MQKCSALSTVSSLRVPKTSPFVVCNPSQFQPISSICVPLWFIDTFKMTFYLGKPLVPGSLRLKGDFWPWNELFGRSDVLRSLDSKKGPLYCPLNQPAEKGPIVKSWTAFRSLHNKNPYIFCNINLFNTNSQFMEATL